MLMFIMMIHIQAAVILSRVSMGKVLFWKDTDQPKNW